tara:strand:- start:613 stop:1059 length:447 start_codon:yes stop_codon:yes gene_type:complete
MTVTIRLAEAADRDRCLELLQLLGGPNGRPLTPGAAAIFDRLAEQERGEIWVALADGRVVGMASQSFNIAMRYGGEYAQLEELIVDPAARGLKLGGRLLEAAIAGARARGCAEYGLYLVEWTEHNRAFYEKYGLKRVGSEMRMPLADE